MDGQFTDLMTDIGAKARAAAAELACASSERKAAALIAAADAIWRRRQETGLLQTANCALVIDAPKFDAQTPIIGFLGAAE